MSSKAKDLGPGAAVAGAERAVGELVAAGAAWPGDAARRVGDARAAVGAAVEAARAGRRAAVAFTPVELLSALDAVATAALARAPITIHVLPDDARASRFELPASLSTGAGVVVSWSVQDAVDAVLYVRRASEDSETPFVHLIDVPSAQQPVDLPDTAFASDYLGARGASHGELRAGVLEGDASLAAKRAERAYAGRVPFALGSAMRGLVERTGRPIGPIERYETADAEEVIVTVGAAFAVASAVARAAREQGQRVGVLGIRALRPLYAPDVVKALARAKALVVVEPVDVALAPSGPIAAELKAAFADAITWAPGYPGVGHIPPILSVVFATVGSGVAEADIRSALDELVAGDRARRVLVFGSG